MSGLSSAVAAPLRSVAQTVRRAPFQTAGVLLALLLLGGAAYWRFGRQPGRGGDTGEMHWQEAQRAVEAYDWVEARSHLLECVKTRASSAEVQFLLARTCRRADDPDGWQKYLREAQVLGWPPAQIDLESRLMRAQGGYFRAIEGSLLSYVQSQSPDRLLVIEALVRGYLENRAFEPVSKLTELWIELAPRDWHASLYRGRAYHLRFNFLVAIPAYRHVLELKPEQPQALFWLADSLMLNSELPEALGCFQAYLSTHPDDPDALLGAANCLVELGQHEAARATLDKLQAAYPDGQSAYLLRAILDLDDDRPADALAWLKKAEANTPTEVNVLTRLLDAYGRLRQPDEVARYQQKLKEVRQQLQELEGLRKRIASESANVALLFQAAELCQRLGHTDEALHWYQAVVRLEPNHGPANRALADYFEKQGDARRAAYHRRLGQ